MILGEIYTQHHEWLSTIQQHFASSFDQMVIDAFVINLTTGQCDVTLTC